MLPYISLYISTYAQEQMFLHAGFLCVGWPGFRKCICNFRSESNVLPDCLSEGYADASVLHWFLFLRILTNTWLSDGFKMELIVVIYVFLITNKVGHLMCLLAIGFSFSVSCVFISSPIILLVWFSFLLTILSFKNICWIPINQYVFPVYNVYFHSVYDILK